MAALLRHSSLDRSLNRPDGVLEYGGGLVQSPAEDEDTERTGLLWKPNDNSSVSDTLQGSGSDDRPDVEAAHEYDIEHLPWLRKAMFYATIMSGCLTMLPFWILIAFLIFTLSVADFPEGPIVFIALVCLIPMTAYATYKTGLILIRGNANT